MSQTQIESYDVLPGQLMVQACELRSAASIMLDKHVQLQEEETWELLHQKQSKFAFSEPPLVDDIINIINQSHPRKSPWPVVNQNVNNVGTQARVIFQDVIG